MRAFLFILFVIFAPLSTASSLGTWDPINIAGQQKYSTHFAACSAYRTKTPGDTWTYINKGVDRYDCQYNGAGSGPFNWGDVLRTYENCEFGDNGASCNASCESPNVMENGQCVAGPPPDPCFSGYGVSRKFTISGNSSDPGAFYQPIAGGEYYATPDSIVVGGCGATPEPGVVCIPGGNGDFTCTGFAVGQGVTVEPSAGAPESEECSEADCPSTDPTPTSDNSSDCTPWTFGEFGLERNCSSVENNNQPGKSTCLTNGSLVCSKPSPTPTSTGTSTSTAETKVTNSETGDITTSKTDIINKTYCSAGACTTTTTTNKSTTVNNAAGEQIGKSGECTGPDCASSTNPDANGDGLGDCVKDCEEEQEGSAAVSESCEAAPVCDGDPFQCAILVQVHYNSCQERRPLNEEEEQAIEQAITASETANDQAQSELDSSLGTFFSGFQAAASGNTSPGSGVCWPDKVISMPFGASFVMPFSQVCPFIELFRIALLAIAYLFSARIIHTQI